MVPALRKKKGGGFPVYDIERNIYSKHEKCSIGKYHEERSQRTGLVLEAPPLFFFIKLCNRIFVESFMKNLTKRQYTVPDFLYSYLYNFFVNNLLIIKSFLSLVESTT